MYLNWILSLLVHKGVLTLEEGESMAEKLAQSIYSQTFKDAHLTIERLLNEVDKKRKIL